MRFRNYTVNEFNSLHPTQIIVATTDGSDLTVVDLQQMKKDHIGKTNTEILDDALRHVSGNMQEVIVVEYNVPFKALII